MCASENELHIQIDGIIAARAGWRKAKLCDL
jgi:hypothetical protein